MHLTQRLEDVHSDVRLAVRQLISAPGFTLVATLTLALGIGVNSAIFSLADAALLRPLPFGEAERLVMLWERTPPPLRPACRRSTCATGACRADRSRGLPSSSEAWAAVRC